jgi:hypothetical protein
MSEKPSRSAPVGTARSGPNPSKIDDDPTQRGKAVYFAVVAVPWVIMALLVALAIFGKHQVSCTAGCG